MSEHGCRDEGLCAERGPVDESVDSDAQADECSHQEQKICGEERGVEALESPGRGGHGGGPVVGALRAGLTSEAVGAKFLTRSRLFPEYQRSI